MITQRVWATTLLAVALAAALSVVFTMAQFTAPAAAEDGHMVVRILGALAVIPIAGAKSSTAFHRARALKTAHEQAPAMRAAQRAWWAHGEQMLSRLAGGNPPAALTVWGLVLQPGELAHLHLSLTYSRCYGHELTYSRGGGFYLGPPAMLLAAAVGNLIGDSIAGSRAAAAARVQWRDPLPCPVIVTNQRLICQVDGQWISFHHAQLSAVYPDPNNWRVTMEYAGTYPLRLHGLGAPAAMVYLCWAAHGPDNLTRHPALAPLAGGLPDRGPHRDE